MNRTIHSFHGNHRTFDFEQIEAGVIITIYPPICFNQGRKVHLFPNETLPDIEKTQQWAEGIGHIQDMLKPLSANAMEFLISGMTPEEWNLLFPEEETE
jgi:hypothetical protein